MYLVEYRTPYTNEVRTQEFPNRKEAERMAAFYRSCGVRAGTRSNWQYSPLSRGFFIVVPLQLCLNMTMNQLRYILRMAKKEARNINEQVKSVNDMRTQTVVVWL